MRLEPGLRRRGCRSRGRGRRHGDRRLDRLPVRRQRRRRVKPTLGLWSRAGVVPISADQDTAGPMARNVTDAAVLLGAATGVDSNDAATAAQAGHAFTDYTQFLDDEALEGARIGVWRAGTYDKHLVGSVVEPILDRHGRRAEGRRCDRDRRNRHRPVGDRNEFPALCEFKTDIATYLQTYVDGTNPVSGQPYPQTLADLIAFDTANPRLEGPWNDASSRLPRRPTGATPSAPTSGAGDTPPVQDAIDQLMAENDLDAIIALTNGPAWPTNDDPTKATSTAASSTSWAHRRRLRCRATPTSRCPPATSTGLPIGITFIGGRWAEPKLLGLAYDFEQATQVRVPPTFIPTIGDELFPGVPNPRINCGAAAAGDPARSRRAPAVEEACERRRGSRLSPIPRRRAWLSEAAVRVRASSSPWNAPPTGAMITLVS